MIAQQFLVLALCFSLGASHVLLLKPTKKPPQPASTLRPTSTKAPTFVCPHDGYFSDPLDCHSYYHCINGVAYRQTCPPKTFWDEIKDTCLFGSYPGCYQ